MQITYTKTFKKVSSCSFLPLATLEFANKSVAEPDPDQNKFSAKFLQEFFLGENML
jgi:hypothetical protein